MTLLAVSALSSFTSLRALSLYKTSDISALRGLSSLIYLDIDSTLVDDISTLGPLISLTQLQATLVSVLAERHQAFGARPTA